MRKLKELATTAWQLLRAPTYLLLALHVIIGFMVGFLENSISLQAFINSIDGLRLLAALLIIGLWYINAAGINDLADYEIDTINLANHKERPLVNGQSDKRSLMLVITATFVLQIVLLAFLGAAAVALGVLMLLLNLQYSFKPLRFSYRGVIAQLLLPLGYVVYPLLLGRIVTGAAWSWLYSVILLALYLQFVARVMLKDFRDVEGDKKYGKLTFLLRHNPSFVTRWSLVSFIGSSIGIGAVLLSFNSLMLMILLAVLVGFAVRVYKGLAQRSEWHNQKHYLPVLSRLMSQSTLLLFIVLMYENNELSFTEYVALVTLTTAITLYITYEKFAVITEKSVSA